MEKVWRCSVCCEDYRSSSGRVKWRFSPLKHGDRRILAHLLAFHDIPSRELKAAKLVENERTGHLFIGNRSLAVWTSSDIAREDMHRVGSWLSDVMKHQPPPQSRSPY